MIHAVPAGRMELIDYANRQWNGLMGDYYLPRWQMFLQAVITGLKNGKTVDRAALENSWRAHEIRFAAAVGGDYPAGS